MHNFFASCGLCSNQPHSGQYAYEAFDKVSPDREQQYEERGPAKVNNMPKVSVSAGHYTFRDLVNDNPREVYIRRVLKSEYGDLIRKHEENGQHFTDLTFPPDQKSIGYVEDLKVRATWKRISDVVKNPIFIEDRIRPCDIIQGSLGDTNFLTAVAALAQRDYRIRNLFPDLKLNLHGLYMARVTFKGVLQEVIVDDYIPVNQQGDPLFAKPIGNRQVWVMILEKVWAKLHGSYGAIVGKLPSQVLHAFSGAPTYDHQISNDKQKQEQLWQRVHQGSEAGAVFCCGSKGDLIIQKMGLVPSQAYNILKFYFGPYRMVRLRNHWSGREWRGRACRGDVQFWSSISPIDRQNIGFSQQNDGTFFVLWQDFIHYFDILQICKLNGNASYSNCQMTFSRKNAQMFEFQTVGGSITLSLSQHRSQHEGQQHRQAVRSLMIVARQEQAKNGSQYLYVKAGTAIQSQQYLQLKGLTKGKYVVYAKILWHTKPEQSACMGLYSQFPTHLAHISQSKHKKFLYKTFLDHARRNPKKQQIGHGQWICKDLLLKECGYGYMAFHIDEFSPRKLGIELSESDFTQKRLYLKKPYRGKGHIKTSVSSGNQLIIVFKIKCQQLPHSVTLPSPKIYNLI